MFSKQGGIESLGLLRPRRPFLSRLVIKKTFFSSAASSYRLVRVALRLGAHIG